jgi:hypothetical protein
MPTHIIRPEREVTIVLHETPGVQEASAAALRTLLHAKRIKAQLIIHNPTTWEYWDFVVRLVKNHGGNAATAGALLACLKMWLADRRGRRVEIRRHRLTVKAPTVRELKQALTAINDYDKLTIELQTPRSPKKRRTKKHSVKPKAKRTAKLRPRKVRDA